VCSYDEHKSDEIQIKAQYLLLLLWLAGVGRWVLGDCMVWWARQGGGPRFSPVVIIKNMI